MVVIFLPATVDMGVTHERAASPSICTVQAPHKAMPQPNFVPVMFSVSRKTHSSGISGLTSTVCGLPFSTKLMAMIPPIQKYGLSTKQVCEVGISYNNLTCKPRPPNYWGGACGFGV